MCRGKVSEGLDFADNNARAVITVSTSHIMLSIIKILLHMLRLGVSHLFFLIMTGWHSFSKY